jgi:hypothetical protein
MSRKSLSDRHLTGSVLMGIFGLAGPSPPVLAQDHQRSEPPRESSARGSRAEPSVHLGSNYAGLGMYGSRHRRELRSSTACERKPAPPVGSTRVPAVVGGPRLRRSRHQRSSFTRLRSASTIMATSSSSVIVGCQPSSAFTFEAFPQRAGTSAGRAISGSTLTYSRQSRLT